MFKFTIRELALVTTIVAMTAVISLQYWPLLAQKRFTTTELEVYSVAIRETMTRYSGGGRSDLYVSIAGSDPPAKLIGMVLRPASAGGEPRTTIDVKILRWVNSDEVEVECRSVIDSKWAAGGTILIHRESGHWRCAAELEGWTGTLNRP